MQNNDYSINKGEGTDARKIIEKVTALYVEVYAEPPYNSGPLYQREAFESRTERQMNNDDFSFVWATSAKGDLVGFSFGLPFGPGKWWAGRASSPPDDILQSRKFAIIELVVDRRWRGKGVGKNLLDTLLQDRSEKYAILTADPEAPARQIYEHWGWEQTGIAQHTDDAPLMHQLVLRRGLPAGPS